MLAATRSVRGGLPVTDPILSSRWFNTIITELAEMGVPDRLMESMSGRSFAEDAGPLLPRQIGCQEEGSGRTRRLAGSLAGQRTSDAMDR